MRSFLAALLATALVSFPSPLTLGAEPPPLPSAQDGGGPTAVGPLGSLPPRPALVEAAPDAPEGQLAVAPPVVWLDLPPGMSAQPQLTVMNGTATTVALDVETVPLTAGPDGEPIPLAAPVAVGDVAGSSGPGSGDATPSGPDERRVPSAAPWVLLAERSLHLGPVERAHLWPSVGVPDDAGDEAAAAAIRVHTSDGPEVAAIVAVDPGGAPSEIEVSAGLRRQGTAEAVARLTVRSPELTSVEGRLEVRSWWGSDVVDLPVPPTLVLPGVARVQEVAFRAPAIPGPYRLTVDLTPRRASAVSAVDRTILWSPLAAAVVVLLVVVAALTVVVRRRSTWT